MSHECPLDLIVLVPGKDEKQTIEGLLTTRQRSLGIRSVIFDILAHPRRDPGCYNEAQDILQSYINRARYALVMFDHEGSGHENEMAEKVSANLRNRLERSGWQDRIDIILIEPELEMWVWSDYSEVEVVLGWGNRAPALRPWLVQKGFLTQEQLKPNRPKEAIQAALREVRVRRSSAIYRQLAERIELEKCRDQAFLKLKEVLRTWFPEKSTYEE